MKILTILGLVQTCILLLLLSKIVLFENESTIAWHPEQKTLVGDSFDAQPSDSHATAIYYPDETQLRRIIREELAASLGALSTTRAQDPPATVSEPIDEEQNEYQRELVAGQIEYYSSVGYISDMEMQKLQGEIAKLDEASAKEMVRKLVGAMNEGKLAGRL